MLGHDLAEAIGLEFMDSQPLLQVSPLRTLELVHDLAGLPDALLKRRIDALTKATQWGRSIEDVAPRVRPP